MGKNNDLSKVMDAIYESVAESLQKQMAEGHENKWLTLMDTLPKHHYAPEPDKFSVQIKGPGPPIPAHLMKEAQEAQASAGFGAILTGIADAGDWGVSYFEFTMPDGKKKKIPFANVNAKATLFGMDFALDPALPSNTVIFVGDKHHGFSNWVGSAIKDHKRNCLVHTSYNTTELVVALCVPGGTILQQAQETAYEPSVIFKIDAPLPAGTQWAILTPLGEILGTGATNHDMFPGDTLTLTIYKSQKKKKKMPPKNPQPF